MLLLAVPMHSCGEPTGSLLGCKVESLKGFKKPQWKKVNKYNKNPNSHPTPTRARHPPWKHFQQGAEPENSTLGQCTGRRLSWYPSPLQAWNAAMSYTHSSRALRLTTSHGWPSRTCLRRHHGLTDNCPGLRNRRGHWLTLRLFLKAPASEFTSSAYFRTLSYRTRASLHFFTST